MNKCKLNEEIPCTDHKMKCQTCDVYNELSQEDNPITLTNHDRLKAAIEFCKPKGNKND